MSWVRFDDGFPEHPKVIAAGGDAAWLHVCAMAWANRHPKASGVIPRELVPRLSDRKNPLNLAARLVDVGIWKNHPTGFEIHDYHEFQPTAEEAEERRAKRSEAGRKGGIRSGESRREAKQRSSDEASCFDDRSHSVEANANPDPTRPDPTPSELSNSTQTDRPMTVGASSVSPSMWRACEVYAEHVYQSDPRKCRGNVARYKAGIARIALDEHIDALNAADGTPEDVARFVFGLNELDLFRIRKGA